MVDLDFKNSTLVVGPESELYKDFLIASQVNWVRPFSGLDSIECVAKIRSRHEGAEAEVVLFENQTVHVRFKEKQRAITPGQSIVFYTGDEMIGGGVIDSASDFTHVAMK